MKQGVDYNSHHILFSRKLWDATPNTYQLRNNSGLIVPMELGAHAALHREVTIVPVLDHYAAQVALNGMRRAHPHDPLEAMDDFMLAVEAAGKHRYSNELDRQLGQLVIATLDAQRPFIRAGRITL